MYEYNKTLFSCTERRLDQLPISFREEFLKNLQQINKNSYDSIYKIFEINRNIDSKIFGFYSDQTSKVTKLLKEFHQSSESTLLLLDENFKESEIPSINIEESLKSFISLEFSKQERIRSQPTLNIRKEDHPFVQAKKPSSQTFKSRGNVYDQDCSSDKIVNYSMQYKSKGLKNINNSCYFNSIIQALVHCESFKIENSSNSFLDLLMNLIALMRDPQYPQEYCDDFHKQCLLELFSSNEDFRSGEQFDPKYLLIYIDQLLSQHQPDTNFFKWKKYIKFQHSTNDYYYYNIHNENFPEQVVKVINASSNRGIVLVDDLKVLFENLTKLGDCQVLGYCTKCSLNVSGTEKVERVEKAQYAIFAFSSLNISCNLLEIKSFEAYPYRLTLNTVIMRIGQDFNRGHNYAICVEGSRFIEYNDNIVKEVAMSSVRGVYLLFYKVESH